MSSFAQGSLVRVKTHFPPSPPAHCRTPFYIRGCVGKIERICGMFENPEELSEEDLVPIIGRDALIGVVEVKAP